MREIVFQTSCGCERSSKWPDPLPPEIRVALMPRPASASVFESEPSISTMIAVRIFKAVGPLRGMPRYLESGLALASLPETPRLVREELADATARFMGFQNAGFGAEWAKVREEFCRRHDGATMVVHAPSRALIGAFYPAPQWHDAEDAVRLFRLLSLLGDV